MKPFFVAIWIALLSISALFAQGRWTWQNPRPQGNQLMGIHVSGNGEILAAGDNGTLVRSQDNGLNWDVQSYAFGYGDHKITHLDFFDDNTGWLINERHQTAYKELFYTQDGGQTWEQRTLYYAYARIGDLFVQDAQNLWMTTWATADLFHSADGGLTWTNIEVASNQDFVAANVYFLDQNRGWAVGYQLIGSGDYGKVYKTTDGGATWDSLYTNPNRGTAVSQIYFADENTGWIAGVDALIMGTTDGGQTWTSQFHRPNTNYAVLDMHFYDAQNGVVVGTDDRILINGDRVDRGLVVTTTDGGQNWELRDGVVDTWIYDVSASGDSTLWACGSGGWMVTSENRGQTWTRASQGSDRAQLKCITFSDEQTGWAGGGSDGVLWKTEDGGDNWFVADSGESPITIIQFLDPLNGYRFEWYGQQYRTRDGGNSWVLTDTLGRDGLYQNGFFADISTGWLSWNYLGDGYIKKTTDGGQTWQTVFNTPDIWLWESDFVDSQTGWICGGHNTTISDQKGFIYKTTDGGQTWQEQLGNYQEPLYEIDFIDANNGWCAGAWGNLLATTDGGQTWNPVTIPFSGTLTEVALLDNNIAWITANDGVGRTLDGGQTWEIFEMPDGQSRIYGAGYFPSPNKGWLAGFSPQILYFEGEPPPLK
ncbi:MAG TPA: YCF48-related protein, partial [Calditrichia bacterium]|nr:YCF48-related protein [Calditrichia bacterium]